MTPEESIICRLRHLARGDRLPVTFTSPRGKVGRIEYMGIVAPNDSFVPYSDMTLPQLQEVVREGEKFIAFTERTKTERAKRFPGPRLGQPPIKADLSWLDDGDVPF